MNDKNQSSPLSESDRALCERVAEAGEELPEGLHERVSAAVRERIAAERVRENARRIRAARRFAVGFAACFILFAAAGAIFLLPLLPAKSGTAAPADTTAALLTDAPAEEQFGGGSDVRPPENAAVPENAGEKQSADDGEARTSPILQPTGALTEQSPKNGALPSESTEVKRTESRRVTTLILILAGLLAVASFIAFIISLSDVRRRTADLLPKNNDKDENP